MSTKTFAAIDIGSFESSMKIFEFSGKNRMREIDCIRQRVDLGSDTYATGKISNEKIEELCRVLNEFSDIMKSYRVESYKVYGTSAIRETENSLIILDKIAQRTGIRVETLSNSEQRFLDYKSVASKGESFRKILEEPTAIVDIGGGSIQISLFEKDSLISTMNLKLGVLRIQEMIGHLEVNSSLKENLIDELVSAQLVTYKKLYLKDRTVRNIIVVDDYISPWAVRKSKKEEKQIMEVEELGKLIDYLKSKGSTQIAQSLDVSEETVPLLFISTILTERIAEIMDASFVWAPGVTLCDGIAYEYAERNKLLSGEHDFEKDIIACAMNISKRYMGSRRRAETLEKIASTIFDSMKKVHGLGKRERLYLQIAAILHDCGKYISLIDIGETSYNIIMATEIIGLSHMEREIVANIVRYNHSKFEYYNQMQQKATGLDRESYLKVAKLTAILRISNSLDRSHKQKMKGVKAALKENELLLTVDTQQDITLERGFFDSSCEFFQEVFSVKPILKQKKTF